MPQPPLREKLLDIYECLFARYGPQHWWPAEEPFEVMVGAVLTQSVAWKNVEKAIANLKAAGVLSPEALRRIDSNVLAASIHACGYYNVKARKLKALVCWLGETCHDDLPALFSREAAQLRADLLSVYGVGPETADSIVLYAAEKPIFVIDAYTRRITGRIGLKPLAEDYNAYQAMFMENLPHDSTLFNEYHALFVCLGKNICRKQPLCGECCLAAICSTGKTCAHP